MKKKPQTTDFDTAKSILEACSCLSAKEIGRGISSLKDKKEWLDKIGGRCLVTIIRYRNPYTPKEDQIECIKVLIKEGVNPNAGIDANGISHALFWAIRNDDRDIAELLISCGCDPLLEDYNGETVFDALEEIGLVENECLSMVKAYVEHESMQNSVFEPLVAPSSAPIASI